jgi:hypothetical protein
MKFKPIAILIAVFLFAVIALADQAAYITKAQAEKAAAFLKDKKQIRHFCAPCEDKGDRVEDVASVEAAATGYQQFWEVIVNGKSIDLAYVYFRTDDGKWKNLAKEMNIKVKDVPKYLE